MKTLSFEQTINAPAQKVWDILWGQETYGEWTKHFSEGSNMKADWRIGGETRFLDASGKNGMISTITKLEPPLEVVFSHIGMINEGVEDLTSDDVKKFAGALESYKLSEENGVTQLSGSVDTFPEHEETMKNGFEKGFEEVKNLAEN